MATTARGAFPYPVPGDDADVPADLQALAQQVATLTAFYGQGTLAARPAAGTAGRFYHVTSGASAGMTFYDTGSTWAVVGTGASSPTYWSSMMLMGV